MENTLRLNMKSKIENFKQIIDNNKKLHFIISDVNYENIKRKEGKQSKYCYIMEDNNSLGNHLTDGRSSYLKK